MMRMTRYIGIFLTFFFSEIKFNHGGLIISLFVIIFILPCLILKRGKGAS